MYRYKRDPQVRPYEIVEAPKSSPSLLIVLHTMSLITASTPFLTSVPPHSQSLEAFREASTLNPQSTEVQLKLKQHVRLVREQRRGGTAAGQTQS